MNAFFPGFVPLHVDAGGVTFRGVVGGAGPPVLLLHGFPQTHVAWRRVAPRLARSFTVVVPDLPGYGASRTGVDDGRRWTKRRVAASLVALMDALGHHRFAVVGHDRGARAGYRLALDHPDRVDRYASLAVVPTLDAWDATDAGFALANFHWFFLAQPGDLPERLLAADPDAFIDQALARMAGGLEKVEPAAIQAYRTAFRDPSVRHAICEDYRAAADEDRADDRADRAAERRIRAPVLVLWSEGAHRASPIETWRRWADRVDGAALAAGHLLPEDAADAVSEALLRFLGEPR